MRDYYFTFYLFTLCIISGAYLFQVSAQVLSYKIFWANIKVIGLCLMPLAWLTTTSFVTVRKLPPQWLRRFLWMAVTVNIIIVYTDPWHHLFRESVSLYLLNNIYILKPVFGFWYKTGYIYYMYLIILLSIVYYVYAIVFSPRIKRIQYGFQILAIVIGALGGAVFPLKLSLLDTFVFTIVFTSLIHYFLIYKFGYFDIVSLAKEIVVDKIDKGILIFSSKGELVEMNFAAHQYVSEPKNLETFMDDLDIEKKIINSSETEIKEIHLDGEKKQLLIRLNELAEADRDVYGYLITLTDITEHKKLIQLQAEQEKIEQKKMMVNDVHDGISGSLTIMSMLAGQQFSSEKELRDALENIRQLATETIQETRLIMNSYNRENPNFDELCGDLRHIGNLYTDGTGIQFELVEYNVLCVRLPVRFEIYLHIIRFFKECIVNIIKHSGATNIMSDVETDGQVISIRVKDNGCGFDNNNGKGIGLDSLRFRIEKIGGTLHLDTVDGMAIEVIVPLIQKIEDIDHVSR